MKDIFAPASRWVFSNREYAREPRICVDELERYWLVWIAWDGENEHLLASVKEQGRDWSQPFAISDFRRAIVDLSVSPWKEGILVAWIDSGDTEVDGLKMRHVRGQSSLADVNLILPARRLPFEVDLAAEADKFFLVWTTRTPGGSEISGYVSDDPLAAHVPVRISHRRRLNMRPSAEMRDGAAFVAWEYMTFRQGSRLFFRKIDADQTLQPPVELIGNDGSTNTCCVLQKTDDGLWIAWQSDMDSHLGPQLTRWVEVGHLDESGHLSRPAYAMKDVERHGTGADQGFEFPSLVVCDDGRLVVIGRGSQSLRRQDLTSKGWTRRGQIDDEGWQCRGRYDTALAQEGVLVTGREKKGLTVWLLPENETDKASEKLSLYDNIDFSQSSKGVHILGRRILFGDIHQHTAASDGTGTSVETYNRARYRYGDDLVGIADHESFLDRRTAPGEWLSHCDLADDFYEPGEFVTLYAYEWTGSMHPGPGHKVVYPPSADMSMLFSRDEEKTQTSDGLIREAARVGALVFPHHVGWTGADMAHHDDTVQTCFEIVSCHGAYERAGVGPIGTRGDDKAGQFVADALDNGLRFGFVGGSDGHGLNWHHGVCRMEDSHRSGLTAVFADEVTREGVLEALEKRNCYATSGARIGLWFEIDGKPMGSVVRPGGIASYRVVVHGTADLASVTLVTNGGRETTLKYSERNADVHGTLPPPPDDSSPYYYVRVVQADGHCAWSSPIWLESDYSPIDDRLIG